LPLVDDTSCSYVTPSMLIEPKENDSKRMRARDFGRTEANWQVQVLLGRHLIRVERWKSELQPSLFEASISAAALPEAGAAALEMTP
jgi:hypothetical protein